MVRTVLCDAGQHSECEGSGSIQGVLTPPHEPDAAGEQVWVTVECGCPCHSDPPSSTKGEEPGDERWTIYQDALTERVDGPYTVTQPGDERCGPVEVVRRSTLDEARHDLEETTRDLDGVTDNATRERETRLHLEGIIEQAAQEFEKRATAARDEHDRYLSRGDRVVAGWRDEEARTYRKAAHYLRSALNPSSPDE